MNVLMLAVVVSMSSFMLWSVRTTGHLKYVYLEVLGWYTASSLFIASVHYLPGNQIKDVAVSLLAALCTTAIVLCILALIHRRPSNYQRVIKIGCISAVVAILLTLVSGNTNATMTAGITVQAGALAVGVRHILLSGISQGWAVPLIFLSISPMLVGFVKNDFLDMDWIFVDITILSTIAFTYFVMRSSIGKTRVPSLAKYENFERMTNESRQPNIILDGERIYYANRAALNLYGFEKLEDALKFNPSDAIPYDEDREKSRQVFFDCLTYKKTVHKSKRRRIIRNGRVVELSFSMYPFAWREGGFVTDTMHVVIDNGHEFENPQDYI